MRQPLLRPHEGGRDVRDRGHFHVAQHRKGVVVHVAVAVVEGDHRQVAPRSALAREHLQGIVEPHHLVRLAEDLEVLAESVACDVQGGQRALVLESQVADHAVVAHDEDAHASHRAPLDSRDEVLRARVVQRHRGGALRCSSCHLHRPFLQPLHLPPPPPPSRNGAGPRAFRRRGGHWRVTPFHRPSRAARRTPRRSLRAAASARGAAPVAPLAARPRESPP